MPAFQGQTIALTTDDKVALLRRAWNLAPASANSLLEQILILQQDANDQTEEDISASSSNSHSSTSNQPGANTITDQETLRAWHQLISAFKNVRMFLLNAAKYGLDAFALQRTGCFPNPLPTKITDPAERVTVDTNDQWESFCEKEEIDPALVVNVVPGDEAIFLWLLNNPALLNVSSNVTESRGYYGGAIVGRTGGGF